MYDKFGGQEFQNVVVRTNFPLKIGDTEFAEKEPILMFEKGIIMAGLVAENGTRMAQGGKDNPPLVFWETTPEVSFKLQEGVVSPVGMAILANAKLLETDGNLSVRVLPTLEKKVLSSNGTAFLEYEPVADAPVFVYNESGRKLAPTSEFTLVGNRLTAPETSGEVTVSYYYGHTEKTSTIEIGNGLINGFISVDGEFISVDAETGKHSLMVFSIPKARITSTFILQLGRKMEPSISTFSFTGYKENRDTPVMTISVLNN